MSEILLLRPREIETTLLFRPVFGSRTPKWHIPCQFIFGIKATSLVRTRFWQSDGWSYLRDFTVHRCNKCKLPVYYGEVTVMINHLCVFKHWAAHNEFLWIWIKRICVIQVLSKQICRDLKILGEEYSNKHVCDNYLQFNHPYLSFIWYIP